MALTKEEIKYIEDYLIKSQVEYWDVRIELLDHIVSAVEDKMRKGVLFEEALLEVHKSFGHKTKVYGLMSHKLVKEGLFADSRGFKAFQKEKQKVIGRKYRKQYWQQLKNLLSQPKFMLEYALMVTILILIYKNSQKLAVYGGFILFFTPYFFVAFHALKDKLNRKSLHINMVSTSGFLLLSLFKIPLYTLALFYEDHQAKPYGLFVILLCLIYPCVRASVVLYFEVYKTYKYYYKLQYL